MMKKSMLGGLLGVLFLIGCAGSQKPAAVKVQNVPTPTVGSSVEKPISSAPNSTHEAITPQDPEPEVHYGCH